jgi:hypothetical protein
MSAEAISPPSNREWIELEQGRSAQKECADLKLRPVEALRWQ